MVTQQDVSTFLKDFQLKLGIWGIIYLDKRPKNAQTLASLEISPAERTTVIRTLSVEDYSEGPIEDIIYKGKDLWVFGKRIKNQEVYIKITLGIQNKQTICISFHLSEYPMKYPFKNQKT